MKLYATVRAQKLVNGLDTVVEKSQGSNVWLEVSLTGELEPLGKVILWAPTADRPRYHLVYEDITGETTVLHSLPPKGNKKKDEPCEWCNGQGCFHCNYTRKQ